MSFIPEEDQQYLRERFAEDLLEPVKLLLFTRRASALFVPGAPDPGPGAAHLEETEELLKEVASLSDKLSLEVYDYQRDAEAVLLHHIDKVPAILLQANGAALRFFGVPAGYEFSTFIQDIFDLSTGNIELTQGTQGYITALEQDVHIQVFVTPT